MRITIIKSDQKGIKALEFGRSKLVVFSLLGAVALTAVVALTHFATRWSLQQDLVSEAAIKKWQQELISQKEQLEEAKRISESQIQALSTRLATMQAYLLRLDAAGARLVASAGIEDEFGFGEDPAIGGPSEDVSATTSSYNDVVVFLDQLESNINAKEQELSALESLILDKEINTEQQITGRPITSGWLSSPYGYRADPFTGKRAWHSGVDFSSLEGSDVIVTAAGVVTTVDRKPGYGVFVEVSHGGGYTTRYGHNKSVLVKKGDIVKKGQVIAKVGSTGRSTGPHVHYEITKNGKKLNPYKYLKN